MEAALSRTAKVYSRYGSTTHKQVYIYGRLDPRPTELAGNFGMVWGIGGWLVFAFLQEIGPAAAQKMRERVVAGLKTTFASHYSRTVSLAEALSLDAIADLRQAIDGREVSDHAERGHRPIVGSHPGTSDGSETRQPVPRRQNSRGILPRRRR